MNLKKISYKFLVIITSIQVLLFGKVANGDNPGGIFGFGFITKEEVKKGEIHIEDIPKILENTIDLLLGISGTIAVIFVIIGAYKILFGSLTSEKTKGKDTIIMALTGFVIASLAWFIIKFIIDNFS